MSTSGDAVVDGGATTPPPLEGGTEEAASTGFQFSMPSIEIPEIVIEYFIFSLKLIAPCIVIYQLYLLGKQVFAFVQTQYVCAKPNEWVVIIRNGEQQQAGIGLTCYKTPWDSVAVFPSRNVKVEVKTEQVTKEMQGIGVSTMLEWTIDRYHPLKAYKNLDLASGNFNKANDILRSMTSAIVRNQIANSTIDHIIKNRQELREAILEEMNEVVQGWGVHLCTVEVTDVKILSHSLFQDMQTKFREENIKKATLEKMVAENAIHFEQLEKNLETKKRDLQMYKIQQEASQEQQLKQTRLQIDQFSQQTALEKKELQRSHQEQLRKKVNELKINMNQLDREIAQTKIAVDTSCQKEQSKRAAREQKDQIEKTALLEKMKKEKMEAENTNIMKQKDYDLLIEGFKDPVFFKMEYMQTIADLHKQISWGGFLIYPGDEDPVAQIVQKFTDMATAEL